MCYGLNRHLEKSYNGQKQLEVPHGGTKTLILHSAVKDRADRLITEQGCKCSEAARNFGINRSVLKR